MKSEGLGLRAQGLDRSVEPWLRGTLTEVDAVRRQVLHALELAEEDAAKWVSELADEEVNLRPFGLAPVAFHLRHMSRSLDRLLTYAEGKALSDKQMGDLRTELEPGATVAGVMDEFSAGLALAASRVLLLGDFEQVRGVGRAMLPSTVGGLMVHCAEHTQRHSGQMVTTCRVVLGMRD